MIGFHLDFDMIKKGVEAIKFSRQKRKEREKKDITSGWNPSMHQQTHPTQISSIPLQTACMP